MTTAPLRRDDDGGPVGGPMRPVGVGAVPVSPRDDVEAMRRDLVEGEQFYGTFGNGTGDVGLLGITNRRIMFVNFTLGEERVGLTSVPMGGVSGVSYVTHPSVPLTEATVVGLTIGRAFYEVGCHDPEEARDVHNVLLWHLIGL